MKIRTLFYLLGGQGILNLFKNQLMSFAAITTISACIFVVGIFYTVGVNIEYMLDAVETNMGMTVFFEESTDQERIQEIKKLLEVRSEVHRIDYISPEVAWDRFKTEYFEGKEEQLAGFEGDNPLKDSASLEIYFADLDSQKALSDYVVALPDVRYIRQAEEVVDMMQSINSLVRYSSLTLVAILLIISIFLIANTVRLGISTRQKEIEIMKFIGAKDGFIKGPFVIEGAIIGLIGTVIPLGVIYYFYDQVTLAISNQFTLLTSYLNFMDILVVYKTLVPVSAAVGILIGIIGSRLTIHKYLRV